MELGCETIVEPAMQVTFVGFLAHHRHHAYQIEDFYNAWDVLERVNDTFPEAAHCRHCGGCDATCPRGLEVQRGVNLLIVGSVQDQIRRGALTVDVDAIEVPAARGDN